MVPVKQTSRRWLCSGRHPNRVVLSSLSENVEVAGFADRRGRRSPRSRAPRRGRLPSLRRGYVTCGRVCVAVAAVLLGSLPWAVAADAQVERPIIDIGRTNLDGSRVNPSFIRIAGNAGALAADGKHLYWTSYAVIGRSNLDGSGVEPIFIRVPMISRLGATPQGPLMLTVDGGHIYWSTSESVPFGATVSGLWRANLDGSGIESVLQSHEIGAAAVGAGHIYWTDGVTGTIGRANLDGTGVERSFIATGSDIIGAVVVAGTHIYWSDLCRTSPRCNDGAIGRANLDGSDVRRSFITRLGAPTALAVSAAGVYWADLCSSMRGPKACRSDSIGRGNPDGSAVQRRLIAMPRAVVQGLAVSGRHVYFTSTPNPWLQALRIDPRTLSLHGRLVGGRCRPESQANRTHPACPRPIRLQITYQLNIPAYVSLVIRQRVPGRRVNGRCVAPTPQNRGHPTCTRLTDIPRAEPLQDLPGRAGTNHFTFNGTIMIAERQHGRVHVVAHKLTPGSYQLSAWAFNRADIKSVDFRITR